MYKINDHLFLISHSLITCIKQIPKLIIFLLLCQQAIIFPAATPQSPRDDSSMHVMGSEQHLRNTFILLINNLIRSIKDNDLTLFTLTIKNFESASFPQQLATYLMTYKNRAGQTVMGYIGRVNELFNKELLDDYKQKIDSKNNKNTATLDSHIMSTMHESTLTGFEYDDMVSDTMSAADLRIFNGRLNELEAKFEIPQRPKSRWPIPSPTISAYDQAILDQNLSEAAAQGRTILVAELLESRAHVNGVTMHSRTPLMNASLSGHSQSTLQLIKAKADINTRDQNGRTALIHAAFRGHIIVAGQLLSAKAIVDEKDNSHMTALMWAAHSGHHTIIQALLNAKASIDEKNKFRNTALDFAMANKDISAIEKNKIRKLLQSPTINNR